MVADTTGEFAEKTDGRTPLADIPVDGTKLNDEDTSSIASSGSIPEDQTNFVHNFQKSFSAFCSDHSKALFRVFYAVGLSVFIVYFAYAIYYDAELAKTLIILTSVVVALVGYVFIRDVFGDSIYEHAVRPWLDPINKHWATIQW